LRDICISMVQQNKASERAGSLKSPLECMAYKHII
jgi:hypothetical protein